MVVLFCNLRYKNIVYLCDLQLLYQYFHVRKSEIRTAGYCRNSLHQLDNSTWMVFKSTILLKSFVLFVINWQLFTLHVAAIIAYGNIEVLKPEDFLNH
jgi:hypothetical protein